jgi:DNA polymerase III gamma/tau subunit
MMRPLYERYRPQTWNEVIGQDKAIERIRTAGRRGFGSRAYWISGKSGTGKTTIALLLAREIADSFNIEELDAGQLTPARVSQIERDSLQYAMGTRNGKAYIVNEAHGLRKDTIRHLLVFLERIPEHTMVIFTTTKLGEDSLFEDKIDASPLVSRCIEVPLAQRGLAEAFAKRAREIATAEGLDGQDEKQYLKLANSKQSNMRAILQEIEAGTMLA